MKLTKLKAYLMTHHPLPLLERRVRIAAFMVVIGLAGTLASLLIFHPLSFVGFIVVGIILMLAANVYFLLAIIRGGRTVTIREDQ
jgi:hypothetical protein